MKLEEISVKGEEFRSEIAGIYFGGTRNFGETKGIYVKREEFKVN